MRNRLFFIVLLISSASFSQQFLLPYRSGDLWGYSDSFGNILIEPQYDSVSTSNENQRWQVYKNGRVGVINSKGVELLKPIYSRIKRDPKHSEYHDYFVQLDSLFGYSYMNGTFIIEPKYKELLACEFNYRYDHTEAYNFLVTDNEEENTYKLIDKDEVNLVTGITEITQATDHFYQFKVEDKWGVYNTILHKWSVENRFDTIVRFDNYYDHSQDLIDKPYVFYAKGKGQIFMITDKFEIEESSQEKLDSLLLPPFDDEEEIREIHFAEPISSSNAKFVDLSTISENADGDLDIKKRYSSKLKTIRLLRDKQQVGLEVVSNRFGHLNPEYDAIYTSLNERGRINHMYFLIRKKNKWGVYGMEEDRVVVPVEYDSIVPGEHISDILMVYKKNQVGVLLMGSIYNDAPTYFFRPKFDEFLYRDSARSNDFEYDSHDVYFFKKSGVICPITQYGVKLYD